MAKTLIDRNTPIAVILENYSGAIDLFARLGMGCYACCGAAQETLEEGAIMHGVDVDFVLTQLNQLEEINR